MSVLVTGVSFENRGAELLLHAASEAVSTWGPGYEPVASWRCGSTRQRSGAGVGTHVSVRQAEPFSHVGLGLLPAALRRRAGLSVDGDLRAVLDAHGFLLSDQWGAAMAQRLLVRVLQWERRGVPLVMLPQAFGPFEDPAVASVAAQVVSRAELVCARDRASLAHLEELGVQPRAGAFRLEPDITIGLHVEPRPTDAGDAPVVPNWNIAERADASRRARYVDSLCAAVEELRAAGARPYGLCHEGPADRALLEEVDSRVGQLPVVDGLSGLECKALIAASRVLVAGRFHACVSALSSGVPTVLHGWSHKYHELAHDFAWSDQVADPYDPAATARAVRQALTSTGSAALSARAQDQAAAVARLWQDVRAAVVRG